MLVAGMAAHTEIGKAHEVANQVRRTHKDLKDAQTDAAKYNNRERLFGLPVTNVRYIFIYSGPFVLKIAHPAIKFWS